MLFWSENDIIRDVMSKIADLIGKRFGRLLVLEQAGSNKHGNYRWLCRCDCGKETVVAGGNLNRGNTKSCGCLQREMTGKHALGNTYCKGCHPTEAAKKRIGDAQRGDKGNNWNPDREYIRARKAAAVIMHCMLRRTLKWKSDKSEQILGYSRQDLKQRLESQFLEGMTWDNHGEWHTDHIIPIAYYVKNGITDPKIINALENLQPLWASDNIRKKDKLYINGKL